MGRYTWMRPRDGNPCLLSVVPTLSSREVKHENEAVILKLLMKQEESCGIHCLH